MAFVMKISTASPDAGVQPVVSVSKGEITPPIVQKNEITGGFRLFFDYRPEDGGPVEFRAHLAHGDDVLTEIWSYQWTA